MYNAKDKDISLRISSRESNTINDSTLKIFDLNLSISSVIYLGFIESFSNILFLVTSEKMQIYRIQRPRIAFEAPPPLNGTEFESFDYKNESYCIKMGDVEAEGTLMIFPEKSNLVIANPNANTDIYYKLYDYKTFFELKDLMIGPNLDLMIRPEEGFEDFDMYLVAPLHEIFNVTDINMTGFIEYSNYATYFSKLRNHLIFLNSDTIFTITSDIDYFDKKITGFPIRSSHQIRGANFTSTFLVEDEDGKNDYVYAFSVINGSASFHVFIVSDIVSWIKQIKLTQIRDDGNYVLPYNNRVNFIDGRIIIVNSHRSSDNTNVYYMYNVKGQNLEFMQTITGDNNVVTAVKNIKIQEEIFYILYDNYNYIRVMNLYKNDTQFHKLYSIDNYGKDVYYKAGKC